LIEGNAQLQVPSLGEGFLRKGTKLHNKSNLTSIVSEGDQEISAEFSSQVLFNKNNSLGQDPSLVHKDSMGTDGGLGTLEQEEMEINEMQIDLFTEQMIMQFYKVGSKARKITSLWTEARVIGEYSNIDEQVFCEIMEDVLSAFLLHRANMNGL